MAGSPITWRQGSGFHLRGYGDGGQDGGQVGVRKSAIHDQQSVGMDKDTKT
ncbi:MAG: hypothetical protein WCJ02_16745 [bacterium]